MYSTTASIAAAALLVGQASAFGSAIIKNHCNSNVYLWTTTNVPGEMKTIAAGETFTESYLLNPDGGGISMKLATEPDQFGPITQYEYTVAGNLWYDISNINGFPFMDSGLTLTPSDSSCRSMVCDAGVELCTAAYNVPDDNHATAACGAEADTTLVLCHTNNNVQPVEAAKPAESAPAAVANINVVQPSSSAAPAPAPAPASSSYVAPVVAAPAPTPTSVAPVVAPAPAPATTPAPAPPSDDNIVYFTTFVTKMYTVMADDFEGGIPAKRAEPAADSHHMHKRAEHRHHAHRHADAN